MPRRHSRICRCFAADAAERLRAHDRLRGSLGLCQVVIENQSEYGERATVPGGRAGDDRSRDRDDVPFLGPDRESRLRSLGAPGPEAWRTTETTGIAAELDLTFDMNYGTIVEFPLAEHDGSGDRRRTRDPRCRFCEQSPPRAAFSVPPPCHPGVRRQPSSRRARSATNVPSNSPAPSTRTSPRSGNRSSPSASSEWPDSRFPVPSAIPIGSFKALIRMALSIMPEPELAGFTDTIEWVGNPDQEFDSNLFGGLGCLVYQAHVPFPTGWTALPGGSRSGCTVPAICSSSWPRNGSSCRPTAPLLPRRGPGRHGLRIPERSFSTGVGSDFRPATCMALPCLGLWPRKLASHPVVLKGWTEHVCGNGGLAGRHRSRARSRVE